MYLYGLGAITLAAVIFGIAGAVAKVLFQSDISPIDLTAIRTILACIVFFLFLAFSNRKAFRVKKDDFLLLVGVAVAFTLVNITFYLAIQLTTVAAAITLEYTAPFFIMVIGLITAKRSFSLFDSCVVTTSIIGCLLLTGSGEALFSMDYGVMYGLACGLAFAIYNLLGNECQKRRISTNSITFYSFLFSSVFWLFALPFLTVDKVNYTDDNLLQIAFIAVVATVLPYWLLMFGLKHIEALPATIIGMLDPLVAGIAAYLLIDEILTTMNWVGIVIILVAIIASTMNSRQEGKHT
ncbi:EamA family transporter [Marinomonas transparens]|uniref:DMT family transporter n=1 Tax=Marinomonas transparens TaxID=2795388 RepID=A0A934JU93_9GAMM|nr:DMT family transporter [Marinomonas transparens]MBJ7537470.1 DMT family transporter [Marinomonas transparens]